MSILEEGQQLGVSQASLLGKCLAPLGTESPGARPESAMVLSLECLERRV